MANRGDHYELAFEDYLRSQRVAYVSVSQQRRSLLARGSLKNLDFIVSPSDSVSLLIDVKGRRFPSGTRNKQYWRNWSTWDDLESMACWQDKIGLNSCAMLVFAYEIVGGRAPVSAERLHSFRNRWYAFLGVRVADYIQFARPISARWQTVAMPAKLFRQAAIPFDKILGPSAPNQVGLADEMADPAVGCTASSN